MTGRRQRDGNPLDVVAPPLHVVLASQLIPDLFAGPIGADRTNVPIIAWTNGGGGALRDGARQHESIVIIGVLANQVDAAWRAVRELTHRDPRPPRAAPPPSARGRCPP